MNLVVLRRFVLAACVTISPLVVWGADRPKPTPKSPAKPSKPKTQSTHRSELMDYGPFLNLALNAKGIGDNNTPKAVVIPLGNNAKGEPSHAGAGENPPATVCFDEDLLRYSAGWVDGFIDYKGVTFMGDHGRNPAIRGTQKWYTQKAPGWAGPDGTFKDPRTDVSGPLPHDWARFKGIYRNGNQVVLSYTVGDVQVLEAPSMSKASDDAGDIAFRRDFTIAASAKPMVLNVVNLEKGEGAVDGKIATLTSGDIVTAVGSANLPAGAKLEAKDGAIRLTIPAHGPGEGQAGGASGTSFGIWIWSGAKEKSAQLSQLLEKREAVDLHAYTKGGPGIWKEPVETKVTLGKNDKPYTLDTYEVPFKNPYKSLMRFGGFDFLPDGKTAVISTWSGDVWSVSDISGSPEKVTWKRLASGMFESLGLKVRDGEIFVHCRDGIWRLNDLNGDGEIDFYEVFNNDIHNNAFFHEFAFDLQCDKEGNFYFAKAGPVNPGGRGFQRPMSEHNGCLFKLSKDGKYLEVLATGFRAPNGIGVNPETGQVTTGDNEGTWVPMCPINWITPGYFGGVVDTAHKDLKSTNKKPDLSERPAPICWMPKNIDNSGGGQTWCFSDKWGPFKGNLLHTSYGTCSLFNVMYEFVDGHIQGGVTRFPLKFDSGINRPRFSPFDGQLYISGLTGWQSNGSHEAAFHRVRYTGKPVNMANGLHVTKTGIDITFTSALDPKSATDPGNWSVEQWNYEWAEHYGTPFFSVADPTKKGGEKVKDTVDIKGITLSPDGKTVSLTLAQIQPVMQMNIKYNITAADGTPIKSEIFNTIHKVPGSNATSGNGSVAGKLN
jgi:glucose/arabinose dehydrogenase